jgi:uncharacterized protein
MSKLTGTHSEVGAYEFTTLTTVPGIVQYKGAKLQILDLPGIIEGAKDGKGRGRQVIAVARTCSLIFIVLDVLKPLTDKGIIEKEMEGFGIRLNKKPPNIAFKKKEKGGITVTNTVPLTNFDADEIKAVLSEYRIHNADVNIKEDCTIDEFIDVIEVRDFFACDRSNNMQYGKKFSDKKKLLSTSRFSCLSASHSNRVTGKSTRALL